MFIASNPFVVRVEFPALTALVEYLESRADQQAQIDQLTEQVEALSERLKTSRGHLDDEIHDATQGAPQA